MINFRFPIPDGGRFRALLTVCLSLLCASIVISALPTAGEEAIYDRVVRLHVLAHSDSDADQALKLRVRDAILTFLSRESSASADAEEAETRYRSLLPQIEAVAKETIADAGYTYDCRVTLTRESYPVRSYDGVTLPAGTYRSLRVLIGDADGRNWWCVLFPPLCLSLATEPEAQIPAVVSEDGAPSTAEEVLLAAGFTPYEVSLIAGGTEHSTKTVVRFRIVEWLRTLFSKN